MTEKEKMRHAYFHGVSISGKPYFFNPNTVNPEIEAGFEEWYKNFEQSLKYAVKPGDWHTSSRTGISYRILNVAADGCLLTIEPFAPFIRTSSGIEPEGPQSGT